MMGKARRVGDRLRRVRLNAQGHAIAPTARFRSGCFVGPSEHRLTVGQRSLVNHGCFFDMGAPVTIGDDCSLGYEVMVLTISHDASDSRRRAGEPRFEEVTIEDGAWIGARATLLPGVTIGEGAIVATGSVVTEDCKPHSLYAGVPASFKRALP